LASVGDGAPVNLIVRRHISVEPPDTQEKRIRFGCGFVMGLVVGAYMAIHLALYNGYYFVAVLVLTALGCALAAAKSGDRFWLAVKDFIKLFTWRR
jgi:hypothetical protein